MRVPSSMEGRAGWQEHGVAGYLSPTPPPGRKQREMDAGAWFDFSLLSSLGSQWADNPVET